VIYGLYMAKVVNVHDGDTITLDIDLGFGIRLPGQSWTGKTMLSCRIYGINAPELNTPEGKAARDFALTLVSPGDLVTVMSISWDKYGGRFDGTVMMDDGRYFATEMLEAGHAVAES